MKTTLTTRFQRGPMLWGLAMLLLALPAAAQTGDFQLHGRISFDTGNVVLKAASGNEWAQGSVNTLVMPGDTLWVDQEGSTEVEMAGGSFLRLADASKAEVLGLPPSASIRGWVGAFYVQRTARSQGAFLFSTPAATLDIPPDSSVRVDIGERGDTVVSVRWGSAGVRADVGGTVNVTEGRRVWVDPGMLPSDAVAFDRLVTDAFDQWNNDRARLLADGLKTLPREVAVTTPAIGVSDLGQYGEWVYVDSRPYWRPTVVVNYVPYRQGYWNYVPAYGHVWADPYPFSYVTSHYGRWRHTAGYGWVWGWDPVWSPAWVTTVAVGDYFMWAPMDYYSRPVLVTGASYFSIGGVSFCSASTSYMSSSYLRYGYASVYPVNTVVINTFTSTPVNQINIWNININTGGRGGRDHRRPQTALDTSVFTVRDYTPQRSIRGIPADAGLKGPAPVERARTLEARLGREQFSPADRGGVRKDRSTATAGQDRGVPARSVRLANTEARQPVARDAARIAAPGADPVKDRPGVRGETASEVARRAPDRTTTLNNESAVPQSVGNLRGRTPAEGGMEGRGVRGGNTVPEPAKDTRAPQRTVERSAPGTPPTSAATAPGRVERTAPQQVRTEPPTRTTPSTRTAPPTRSSAPVTSTPAERGGGRVALRDMEPGAPAPTTPRKTEPRGTLPQRSTGMGLVPDSRPTSSVRSAPAPVQSAPQRPAPTPSVRSNPAPTSSMRSNPVQAPQRQAPQRQAPTPSVRSNPVQAPSYSAPKRQAPTPSYSAPQRQAPTPSYSAPQRQAPAPSYSAPQRQAPAPSYSAPQRQAPAPSYSAPQRQAPAPSYSAPRSSGRSDSAPAPQTRGGSSGSGRATRSR